MLFVGVPHFRCILSKGVLYYEQSNNTLAVDFSTLNAYFKCMGEDLKLEGEDLKTLDADLKTLDAGGVAQGLVWFI